MVGRGCEHLPPCLKSRQVWCMCTGEGFSVVGLMLMSGKLESQDAHVKPCFHMNPCLGWLCMPLILALWQADLRLPLVYIVSSSPATVIQ